MSSYLPTAEGFLPLYILFVGVTAVGNAVQCYNTMSYTQRVYPGQVTSKNPSSTSPATPLSSRTFGTWTFAVGLVRIFAAYHINEASWYQMQMITNTIGLVHFFLEAFYFKTSPPSGPWLAPVGVSSFGLIWSILQYDFYVK